MIDSIIDLLFKTVAVLHFMTLVGYILATLFAPKEEST